MTKRKLKNRLRRELPLHLMLLPGIIFIFIFRYIPMYGIAIAFQDFIPAKGLFGDQVWNGFDNLQYVFSMPNFLRVLWNTLFISTMKMFFSFFIVIIVALLVNEVRSNLFRRSIQTVIYFPHFLSWVIISGMLLDILSPSSGIVNMAIKAFGLKPIYFLGNKKVFPWTMIFTSIWKEFGFGTVVYLAAMAGIDPNLYEAAIIDGANRYQRAIHITVPGIRMVIVLLMVLSLGSILSAGFEQILNLYNELVMETGDIIDTLVYRLGLMDAIYGPAAAIGLFKSAVSLILISGSYFIAYKYFDYQLF